MDLTDQDIEEFVAIWRQEFHEDLPLAEARTRATQLLELCAILIEGPKAPRLDEVEPAIND